MFEFILQNLSLVVGIVLGIGGGLAGFLQWHKKAVEKAFKEGKQEEICLARIENKADEAIKDVEALDKKMTENVEKGDEHHRRLYEKLDNHAKILSEINSTVSYIRGKVER